MTEGESIEASTYQAFGSSSRAAYRIKSRLSCLPLCEQLQSHFRKAISTPFSGAPLRSGFHRPLVKPLLCEPLQSHFGKVVSTPFPGAPLTKWLSEAT